jgi:hypothetical protein
MKLSSLPPLVFSRRKISKRPTRKGSKLKRPLLVKISGRWVDFLPE